MVRVTVVMDWFSRYVIAWELSTTLDSDFCVRCLERALESGKPELFNTDQGVQYTSEEFTRTLLSADVRISMTGSGRCFDNIMVERLWRTLKYEYLYLHDYAHPTPMHHGFSAVKHLSQRFPVSFKIWDAGVHIFNRVCYLFPFPLPGSDIRNGK